MAKDVTIEIDMGDDDKPTVSWPQAEDCTQNSEKQPCCYRKHHVTWGPAADVEGRVWAVVFTEGSPFKNDQAVFSPSSPTGKVKDKADEKSYKYWVALADGNGDLKWRDPRIMISEPPSEPTYRYMSLASSLEAFARTSEKLADEAREISEELRGLVPPDDASTAF